MDKNQFITETASKILSSMYCNSEYDPCVKTAVDSAEELYKELLSRKTFIEKK